MRKWSASSRRRSAERGFSLLEVMVAIAILGLSLTVILSAQGGLAASNNTAAKMSIATSLARCKMTELEEKLMKMGYSEIDQIDTDVPCCDDQPSPGFSCATRAEKVELPNPPTTGPGGDAGLDLGGLGGLAGGGADAGLTNVSSLDLDGGLQGLGAQLTATTGGKGAADLLNMVMGMVYPSLKPTLEASIRRLTVKVSWKEGPNEREFSIVQYVTNPQRAGFTGLPMAFGDGGVPLGFGGAGAGGTNPPTTPGAAGAAGVGGLPGATTTPAPSPFGGLRP
jgi:general secretion pathway protein I